MNKKSIAVVLILSALVMGPLAGVAAANVPGVALNAPPPPPAPNVPVAGGMGLFKVVVSHRDTMIPATHYVDHVYLFDGNNLIKEWKYTENDANQNEVFTESMVLPASKDMGLKAIAHCTLHGYNLNGVYVTVAPAGTMPAQMVQTNANIAGTQVNGMPPDKAASMASQMVQQDAALLKQIETNSMSDIRQHQMQTAQFFQTDAGKKFLDAFDYTKKASAGGQAMAAPGMAAQGQMMQGQQMQAQQAPMVAQGQQVKKAADMSDMRAGADAAAGSQAGMAPGQMDRARMGQAAQPLLSASKSQGIPQMVWTDSMGNPIDGNMGIQLGAAAASMQQGPMTGQQPAMQGGMAGQPAGSMTNQPAGAGQQMPGR